MTGQEILASPTPPALESGHAIQALWWAEHGDWGRAHEHAQAGEGNDVAWVHAHLHRVEGDPENAAYWYARAGKPVALGAFDAERQAIALAVAG